MRDEQWSERFTFSQYLFQHRLSSVRAPVCRLLAGVCGVPSTRQTNLVWETRLARHSLRDHR